MDHFTWFDCGSTHQHAIKLKLISQSNIINWLRKREEKMDAVERVENVQFIFDAEKNETRQSWRLFGKVKITEWQARTSVKHMMCFTQQNLIKLFKNNWESSYQARERER